MNRIRPAVEIHDGGLASSCQPHTPPYATGAMCMTAGTRQCAEGRHLSAASPLLPPLVSKGGPDQCHQSLPCLWVLLKYGLPFGTSLVVTSQVLYWTQVRNANCCTDPTSPKDYCRKQPDFDSNGSFRLWKCGTRRIASPSCECVELRNIAISLTSARARGLSHPNA